MTVRVARWLCPGNPGMISFPLAFGASMSRASLAFLPALLLVLACGGEAASGPDAGTPGGAADAASPATALLPVASITASNDLPEHVRVTWARPSQAVTGYRVHRDGLEVGIVGADTITFLDSTAEPASFAAPRATASVDTLRSGIEVSWEPLTQGGSAATRVYSVVAVYGDRMAVPSPEVRGSRAGVVSGFEVTRADGKSFRVAAGVRKIQDADAPKATIAIPAPTVAVDAPRSIISLALPALPKVNAAASTTYRVRALGDRVLGAYSAPVHGRRGAGAPNELDLQWQRSSGPAPTGFMDLPGVTGPAWFDSSAPSGEERHFRVRAAPAWADEVVSTSGVARNMTWRKVATQTGMTCGIDAEERLSCWNRERIVVGPTATRYDDVTVGTVHDRHCARRVDDHKVQCWAAGAPSYAPDVPLTHLASAYLYDCAIRESDHRIICWGPLASSAVPLRQSVDAYQSVAAGGDLVCGVNEATFAIDCFRPIQAAPTLAGGPFRFVAVSSYDPNACGLLSSGGLPSCLRPEMSLPDADYREVKLDVAAKFGIRTTDGAVVSSFGTLSRAGEVYRGLTTSGTSGPCALDSRGHIRCWRGYTTSSLPQRPVLPEGAFSSLVNPSVGASCGPRRSDGRLECASLDYVPPPVLEVSTESYRAVAAHASKGLIGIDATSGTLRYVGRNTADSPALPTGTYKAVTSECGLRASDGKVDCWSASTPATSASSFDAIATNFWGGCGIRSSDKKIECWGTTPGTPPSDPVEALTLGCAIRAVDHKAVCWGSGSRVEPFPDELVAIVDGSPTCGIRRADHTVVCDETPRFETTERFAAWYPTGCGLRENDGKLVCRDGHVPIR